MNPADALRKQQRKRELKKNKEARKTQRESVLAKKDIGKVRQDIARLEHLAASGQLDKTNQTRLEELKIEAKKIEKAKKATELTGAQAAYAARMQENEKKSEKDARKLVFDPKSGKFVPAKKKDSAKTTQSDDDSDSDSDSEDDSDEDSDMEDSDEDIAIPEGDVPAKKILTESDDEYEIPLPPGPPPPRAFDQQFTPIQAAQQRIPPPPPPGPPPFRGPFPVYTPGGRIPPPPPPMPHQIYQPMMGMAPPPPPPPQYHHASRPFTAPVHYQQPPSAAATVSAEPTTSASVTAAASVAPTISAEPQLRDLQKELIGFVPAALRRKQAAANKIASLPKGARPNINAAPSLDEEE